MAVMTAVDSAGRFTRADLDAMPDDGRRYELLDGSIIVTPSPTPAHQNVTLELAVLLRTSCSAELKVFVAPLDTALPTGDVLEPDVLVVRRDTITAKDVTGAPLLAVEILSPSTRRRDVGDKLTAYRDAGVPSYWVVDPINPRLRVWELRDDEYVEIADVSGDEEWTATEPYEVTVRPADLTR
jgi:Uma2 family endonuclease